MFFNSFFFSHSSLFTTLQCQNLSPAHTPFLSQPSSTFDVAASDAELIDQLILSNHEIRGMSKFQAVVQGVRAIKNAKKESENEKEKPKKRKLDLEEDLDTILGSQEREKEKQAQLQLLVKGKLQKEEKKTARRESLKMRLKKEKGVLNKCLQEVETFQQHLFPGMKRLLGLGFSLNTLANLILESTEVI